MPAELHSARGPGESDASGPQGTVVGGTKPLHRFIKGQPKIVGTVVLVLGLSFFVIVISMNPNSFFHIQHIMNGVPSAFLLASLFIICGSLFILTEHNTTKKMVTISFALSIVTILMGIWVAMHVTVNLTTNSYSPYDFYDFHDENTTATDDTYFYHPYQAMAITLEGIMLLYILVGILIFIVMSCLAGAALRSTKSQAIVIMSSLPTEAPVE